MGPTAGLESLRRPAMNQRGVPGVAAPVVASCQSIPAARRDDPLSPAIWPIDVYWSS